MTKSRAMLRVCASRVLALPSACPARWACHAVPNKPSTSASTSASTAAAVAVAVARFQIAVHEQVAVGMRYRIGELQEQAQAGFQGQAARGHIDGLAVDEFEDEVGQALFAGTGIQQARDMRMAQPREGLSLLCEAAQHGAAVDASLQQLDRRPALIAAVGAACFKHFTHATDAHGADDFPRAQALAGVGCAFSIF